jgi:hypothetical protein
MCCGAVWCGGMVQALYSFTFFQEEKKQGDTAPKKTQIKMYYRVPTAQLQSITVSPFCDNFMIFHFSPASGVTDTLLTCRRKTEFLGLLSMACKKEGRQLALTFADKYVCGCGVCGCAGSDRELIVRATHMCCALLRCVQRHFGGEPEEEEVGGGEVDARPADAVG